MELGRGCEPKKKKHLRDGTIALNPETVLVIRIPDFQVLRILSRSLFLATVLASLPFFGTLLKGFPSNSHYSLVPNNETSYKFVNLQLLNLILHDLADQSLVKMDDKVLIVNPPNGFIAPFHNNEIEMVMDSDLERKSLFLDQSYDFVFTSTSVNAEFVDRILKIDGIVAFPLGIVKPSNVAFREQSNYRVVYLRRYGAIIVALKKTGPTIRLVGDSAPKRKLCQMGIELEAKTVALKGLEDVLLEPPTKAFVKSNKYLKRIKYLPDLLGDSLEGYKRRVFIGVGLHEENKGVIQWFEQNYPKKNTKFEIHSLLVAPEERVDISDWLSKHVKEEEYVVMKAEAEVVEKMINEKTIGLVDELFLECKNEWWKMEKRKKHNGRAYWKCLALYGRVRDEGVAVHQWWG